MLRAQGQLHESGSTGRAVRGGGVSFSSALSQASAGKRRAQLGMYYDDVCRRAAAELRCARARAGSGAQEWSERARAADPDFVLQRAIMRVDKRLLGLAEEAYDRDERSKGQALDACASAGGLSRVFFALQAQSSGQAGRAEKGDKAQAPSSRRIARGSGPPPILSCRAARSQVAAGKAAAGKSQWQSGHGYANGGKSAQWSGKRWNSWGSAGEDRGYNWGAAERGGEDNRRPRTPPRPVKKARP